MNKAPDIISLGCRLNALESETIRRHASDASLDDLIVVNSCAVTNEAVRSSRQSVRRARRQNPDAKIVVTGCAAQLHADAFSAMDEVDFVLGNQEKLEPKTWAALANSPTKKNLAKTQVNNIMSVRETAPHMIDGYGDRARAFLQVQTGCDHRCTFCIIPFARGQSRSVEIDAVVEQAKMLVDFGHREIVITGVDITSYGADLEPRQDLGALVATILDRVPDLYRLRLSSIDGAEIDPTLLDRIMHDQRIAASLHISIQSGDNLILKRMKRRHTREDVIELCHTIRAARPEFAFGADIIAGFPTETEAQFQNSVDLIDDAGLQFVHVFPFSPRDGAPAARMPQTPGPIIKERASRLRAKADFAKQQFLDTLAGRIEDGLCESGGLARLSNFVCAKIDTPQNLQPGDLVRLKLGARNADMVDAKPTP